MDGQTAERPHGRLRLLVVSALALVLAVGPSGRPAAAQVGHDPARSLYRDIPLRPVLGFSVGYLSNDRGRVGAGFSDALTFGARYDIPTGRSLLFQLATTYLRGDRFIIDPRADSAAPQRRTGPYNSNLVLVEAGMQLRLTGAKSWRGVAPYAGTALGLTFDVDSPGDTTQSGYKFGTKLTLAFVSGVRLYPARRMVINAEARAQAWRLKYPLSFHAALSPDGSRVIPVSEPLNDWTLHPWLSLGIGWTF
jgi:hypothetical protein